MTILDRSDQDPPAIAFEHVWKRFGDNVVLRDVTLDVHAGETVAIIGPSGSGKSTLLRTINGLVTHDEGRIIVDGVDLVAANDSVATIRRHVGMVFQQFNLFPHLSVIDNIILAPMRVGRVPKAEATLSARKLLERVGLADLEHRFPSQLSGGQQQRVAIARALATKPDILLFDEPTSALDPEMVGEVLAVILDLARTGVTLCVVTHELNFAKKMADKVVVMDDGGIVEIGPPSKVLESPDHETTIRFLKALSGGESS
jgi:ABC-type polar amino acid transport system ATPase subunit